MKQGLFSFLLLLLPLTAVAQQRGCFAGIGSDQLPVTAGYNISVAPSSASAGECQAALAGPDGKPVYTLTAVNLAILGVTGSDINADGKPDAVLESAPSDSQETWNYYVLTPTLTPILLREFSVSTQLHFEDKLGDGKVEIWGRDFAFDGVNNYPHSESPAPLIFFRLRGTTLYDVSTLFWPEYQREIEDAKSGISNEDLGKLTKMEGDHPKAPQPGDPEAEHLQSVEALVLTECLDYLYAGRGPQAWKVIDDDWPLFDHQRIRQVILERRMHGILAQINKPPAPQAAANPPSN